MLKIIARIALAFLAFSAPSVAQVFEEVPMDHPEAQAIWGDVDLMEGTANTPHAWIAKRHDSTLSMLVASGLCGRSCPFRIVGKDGSVVEFSVCVDIDRIWVWHGGLMACDVNHEYPFDIAD